MNTVITQQTPVCFIWSPRPEQKETRYFGEGSPDVHYLRDYHYRSPKITFSEPKLKNTI